MDEKEGAGQEEIRTNGWLGCCSPQRGKSVKKVVESWQTVKKKAKKRKNGEVSFQAQPTESYSMRLPEQMVGGKISGGGEKGEKKKEGEGKRGGERGRGKKKKVKKGGKGGKREGE